VLGDVEETVYLAEDDTEDDVFRTVSKKSEMLFVRGRSRRRVLTSVSGPSLTVI
jgi:hypothetical protein